MTIISFIKKYSKNHHPDDLDIFLARALKKEKEWVLAHPEHNLGVSESLKLKYYLWLYERGFSVAAITHRKEFYGLDFYVNKHVLVPRPETEVMIESVIEEIGNKKLENGETILLIDIGTGSGCVPISIVKTLKNIGYYNIRILATDISRKALHVAKKNAARHKVEIEFVHGNLLKPLLKNTKKLRYNINKHGQTSKYPISNIKYLIITANLPYLTQAQFASEPSIRREPKIALVAKKEGLALYEELLEQIKNLQHQYSICDMRYAIFFEIDPSQSERMVLLANEHFPNAKMEIKKDLAGRDRIVKIQICLNPSLN